MFNINAIIPAIHYRSVKDSSQLTSETPFAQMTQKRKPINKNAIFTKKFEI